MSRPTLSTEDTQPLRPGAGETQPIRASGRGWRTRRRRWLLLAIMLIITFTLMLTTLLFVRAFAERIDSGMGPRLQVSIQQAGTLTTVSTSAETVGELISEQRIDLLPNTSLSPAADQRLSDGMVISILTARDVTIVEDGQTQQFSTSLENPLEILRSAGIAISADDRIWVNDALAHTDALAEWTVPAQHIRIRRRARLTIIDDGAQSTIETNAETVGDALYGAGIALYLTDEVAPPLDSPIRSDMTIRIKRAIPLQLKVDGVTIEARSNGATVAAVLAEYNAPLFGLDYVEPSSDTAVSEGMTIEIVRVTEEVVAETETIAFDSQLQADDTLDLDQRQQIQAGQPGSREIRYRVRYENGAEVSRVHSETVEVAAPVNQIIAFGTRIVPRTVQTPAGPRQYWRRICVIATTYQPSAETNITSRGGKVSQGVIAAKPQIIPYYTKVFVPGYGFGEILDTGAGPASTNFWIDVGYGPGETVNWTTRYSWVYHLMPLPEKVNYLLPTWRPSRSYPTGSCDG